VARGALVVGCYGLVRGLTPLLAARVRSPQQLFEIHKRVDRWRIPAARLGIAALSTIAMASVIGSAS
jgi:hypothetical protein